MPFKKVSKPYGKKFLINDLVFSIENLNLEFDKYPIFDDDEIEFQLLFSEENKTLIPYYCFEYREKNPIFYYLDEGYQNTLLNIKRKVILLNKINNHEDSLIKNLHVNGFKGKQCEEILFHFKELLSKINIQNIDFLEKKSTYDNYDNGEFLSRFLFKDAEVKVYVHPT